MQNEINLFFNHLGVRYSQNTAKAYRKDLEQFIQETGIRSLKDISKEKILQYRAMLLKRHYAPVTIRRKIQAVRNFLKFCYKNGWIETSPRMTLPPKA